MKTRNVTKPLLALLAAVACLCSHVKASTVFWDSVFNDLLFDSNGNALDTSFTFEIGTFGTFEPTYGNVDQWAANWKVIDRAYHESNPLFAPDSQGWSVDNQFFAGTVEHQTDGTSSSPDANPADIFGEGETVYLWVFNSKDIVPSSEWALVTDGTPVGDSLDGSDWLIPNPTDTGSYNWHLTDANTAIIGGANDDRGPGAYSATPAVFSLQTAVVPEPGSALLLLAAAAAHLIRRARHLSRATMH